MGAPCKSLKFQLKLMRSRFWSMTGYKKISTEIENSNIEILLPSSVSKSGILLNSQRVCEADNVFRLRLVQPPFLKIGSKNVIVPIGSGKEYHQLLAAVSKISGLKVVLLTHDPQSLIDFLKFHNSFNIYKCLVHSENAAELILKNSYFEKAQVEVISSGVPSLLNLTAISSTDTKNVVGTLGYWHKGRDIARTARILGLVMKLRPEFKSVWIGKLTIRQKIQISLCLRKNRARGKINYIVGSSDKEFSEAARGLGMALYLRKSTSMESSGLLVELASAGVPTLRNDLGANHDLPTEIFYSLPNASSDLHFAKKAIEIIEADDRSTVKIRLIEYSKKHDLANYVRYLRDAFDRRQ
jgi:hypothetical protein